MPLTNPNKVITEERLSEFYGQILPYMGGMPEVLANKFSRSDIYSTTEKMVGQWTDGKPLYMRSVSKSYTASQMASGSPVDLINLGSDCHVLFASGMVHSTANGSLPINYFDSGTRVNLAFNMNNDGSAIQEGNVWVASNWNKAVTAYVNLYYTKTTDSPISIGSDTDYSTEEKIVGTWIDGKPIYQKVIVNNASIETGDHFYNHGINNLDKVIFACGWCNDKNGYMQVLPAVSTNTNYMIALSNWSATQYYLSPASGMAPITNSHIIVQYTKTTD